MKAHTVSVTEGAATHAEGLGVLDFLGTIGRVVTVLGQSPQYCESPIAVIQLWLESAIRHRLNFFYNESGVALGYMTWAWLTEDTESRLIHDPTVLLHISEWNEGDRLWILDFVLINGDVRASLREAATLFKDVQSAKSLRRRDDGSVRKVTTWRRTSFNNRSRQRK
jgi:cytolysin-activating lysine-acyltransferase